MICAIAVVALAAVSMPAALPEAAVSPAPALSSTCSVAVVARMYTVKDFAQVPPAFEPMFEAPRSIPVFTPEVFRVHRDTVSDEGFTVRP